MDVLVLGILLVLVPISRVIEDGTGDAFGFGLVTQNVFVIISLPDVTRIQFATGTTGDGCFKTGYKRSQCSRFSV